MTCPAFHVAQQWETSLGSPCLLHSFLQPFLPWKVPHTLRICYIPFSSHCSHKKFPILSEYCVVPVFANRGCEPWVGNLQMERKGVLYVAAEAISMVLFIIYHYSRVSTENKNDVAFQTVPTMWGQLLSNRESQKTLFWQRGSLFLALPWMTSGKKMTLCALYPILQKEDSDVLSFDVVAELYVKNSVHGLLLFRNYFPSS